MKKYLEHLRNLFRFKDLYHELVIRDLKLKYRRSFLGYLWSVLNPLGVMFVLTLVFTNVFRFDISNYPAYLISGQILFNFLVESTNQSMFSIVGGASLIKKTYIPKYILTLSKVTSSIINLLFSMVALIIVMVFTKVQLTWYVLLSPLVLLELFAFCLGLGLLLAQAAVFFRDIQYIYSVLTTAWMYFTPIFYPMAMLEGTPVYWVVRYANPMQIYVTQFRNLMLNGMLPDFQSWTMGIIIALVMLVIGVWAFSKRQDRFILYV